MKNHSPMLSRRGLLAAPPALAVPQARAQIAGAPVRVECETAWRPAAESACPKPRPS